MSDYPGQLPARGDSPVHPAQFAGVESQTAVEAPVEPRPWHHLLPEDQDLSVLDDRDPDPKPQRMGSGDHFNSQQFADQLGVAYVRRSAPLVHGQNQTAWYGESDQPNGGCNAR
jgi:hypothetical protein